MPKLTLFASLCLLLFLGGIAWYVSVKGNSLSVGSPTRVCTVTESNVAVGHQQSVTVLAAGSRQWAIIEQPANASNTVSLSLGGTAVAGYGYQLTQATATSPVPELVLGFGTDKPTSVAVTARTASASSSLHVIECK